MISQLPYHKHVEDVTKSQSRGTRDSSPELESNRCLIWFQFGCTQHVCLQVQSLRCFHIDVAESTKAALLLVRSDALTINRWETRYGIDVENRIVVYYTVYTHSGRLHAQKWVAIESVSYLFPLKSVETAALGGCKGERNGMKADPTTFPLPFAPRNMAAFSPRLRVSSRESFIALMEPGYIQQLIWSTRQDRHHQDRPGKERVCVWSQRTPAAATKTHTHMHKRMHTHSACAAPAWQAVPAWEVDPSFQNMIRNKVIFNSMTPEWAWLALAHTHTHTRSGLKNSSFCFPRRPA